VKQPDVVLIYFPSDGGAANCIGCQRVNREWKYSNIVFIPQNEVQDMIREELVSRGMRVFDRRESAKAQNPGMEAATPIIVYSARVPLTKALDAFETFHRAVLELPESEG
jgi:hypothetical protein